MLVKKIQDAFKRHSLPVEKISAVHDDDLETFLSSIGALHDIRSNKCHCKFCGDIISLDNLQTIFPDSGSVSYVCNKEHCLRYFMNYLETRHEYRSGN